MYKIKQTHMCFRLTGTELHHFLTITFSYFAAACEAGEHSCPSNYHLAEKVINPCCSTSFCECNACEEPQMCKEGWTACDTADECGCVKRECQPPTECVYYGETHAPGIDVFVV